MNCPYCGRLLTIGENKIIKDCYDCQIISNIDRQGKTTAMSVNMNKYSLGNLNGSFFIRIKNRHGDPIRYTFAGELGDAFDPYSFKSKTELIDRIKWFLKWKSLG